MPKHFNFIPLGLAGNVMVQYLFARGYCERHGLELHMDEWIGQKIFNIEHPRITTELPRMEESQIGEGLGDVSYRSYSQNQACADFYSVRQAREWLAFRPEILARLQETVRMQHCAHVHLRRGDFLGYSYPGVSLNSAADAAAKFGIETPLVVVTDDAPLIVESFGAELSFLPDFYRLTQAPYMFRANSTFSFVAGILNLGRVFAPIINGKKGGEIHDCEYVEGNWPRLSDFGFVSDIHLKP